MPLGPALCHEPLDNDLRCGWLGDRQLCPQRLEKSSWILVSICPRLPSFHFLLSPQPLLVQRLRCHYQHQARLDRGASLLYMQAHTHTSTHGHRHTSAHRLTHIHTQIHIHSCTDSHTHTSAISWLVFFFSPTLNVHLLDLICTKYAVCLSFPVLQRD